MNIKKHAAHEPFSCELAGANTAVIFVHGILEGPFQFHGLAAKVLDHGMSAFGILLPGHGTTAEGFSKSNRDQWVSFLDGKIEQLSKKYSTIILVGHSMGSLLSLLASEKHDSVVGVVAMATPLAVKVSLKGFICSLKVMTGRYSPNDEYVLASYRAWSITKGTWRNYLHWIPRYLDLFYLMNQTKKRLPHLKKKLLFIHGGCDEFVRYKTVKILKNSLSGADFEVVELCESGHFYYRGDEQQKVEQTILSFIDQFQK